MTTSPVDAESATVVRSPAPPRRRRLALVVLSCISVAMTALAVLAFISGQTDADATADLVEQARSEGVAEGRAAGVTAGRSQAKTSLGQQHDRELAEATLSAYNAGAEFAYPSGVADGRSAGYEEGYAAGVARAMRKVSSTAKPPARRLATATATETEKLPATTRATTTD
ncbi:hypothetical protein [Geodermatophilus nigrescens]|uniref:hypothetical protein n=1 Tax=Geodermatophilus nigrescens TaxID=1070870 RepID=UPI0009351F7D|nr:hypothetical protein [Geodermatophilus nigrescens]